MPRVPPEQRFFKHVKKTDSCWIWIAWKNHGYGQFWIDGKKVQAHRFSYELVKGKIPFGLQIDHLCKNPSCVNPEHLEAVTGYINSVIRGTGPSSVNLRKTHCKLGHEFTEENTVYQRDGRNRQCRICLTQWKKNRSEKLRQITASKPKIVKVNCVRGHKLSGSNLTVNAKGARVCLQCRKERNAKISQLRTRKSKTHCNHGHEWRPETTKNLSNGFRACRVCINEANRRKYWSCRG